MAASSKFDVSSGSPDRSIYTQRGSYSGETLDRPGSFREYKETTILSSLPSMSRSSASVTKGDVTNFLHALPFDSKSMAAEYKFCRQVEFKQLTGIVLGLPANDSSLSTAKTKPLPSPSPGALRRLKASLHKSSTKARDRLKSFSEAISLMNKCFPANTSRKRSRSDGSSSERASALSSGERSVVGSSLSKAGSQTHALVSGSELETQMLGQKVKISIPNKRTRTSMVDGRTGIRTSTPARTFGNIDRGVLRLPSSDTIHAVEQPLSVGVESWQKSKMKKKRSGIKPYVSTEPNDGFREVKQEMQQRLLVDSRPRLNDPHGLRSGVPSGAVEVGKAEVAMQPTGAGIQSSIPKAEQDNNSQLQERIDRPFSVDKERTKFKVVSKTNSKEDFSLPSPTSNTKRNSADRGPSSGPNALHKSSPAVQRTTVGNDWELSHPTRKNSGAGCSNNGKRTASTRPSSPPLTQWSSQRPQKMSRTARKKSSIPIVSSNVNPAFDATSDAMGNKTGSGLGRRLSTDSPQQVKLKGDQFSSPGISESEESGATETKFNDKIKKTDGVDEKAGHNFQKVPAQPPRKNKIVKEDGHEDGVRRKGRTGRGLASTRSLMPFNFKKLGNVVGTTKQLRSARLGLEKTESKVGRPPSRKLSDHKPYARQKQTAISAAADFIGSYTNLVNKNVTHKKSFSCLLSFDHFWNRRPCGSDDGHEELLAAAAAVTDPALGFSSPFWKQMEPYFSFITDTDLAYLKESGHPVLSTQAVQPILNTCSTIPNGFGLNEDDRDSNHMETPELLSPNMALPSYDVPLSQTLLSAIITEEDYEEISSGGDDLDFDDDETALELNKLESDPLNHLLSEDNQFPGRADIDGYKVVANGSCTNDLDHVLLDMDLISEKGLKSDFKFSQNDFSDQTMEPEINSSEIQYPNKSLDEKILMELQSIGIFPDPTPYMIRTGNVEATKDIRRLKEGHLREVSALKEAFVSKLFSSASLTREIQEKEFENRALEKLMNMAYGKYMANFGANPSGKNSSSKIAKQAAALAFVKRTLDHYHQFEDTGKSCFSEAFFREIFISGLTLLEDGPVLDAATSTQQSPSVNNHDKEDSWANRVKKRELSLDEVVGTMSNHSAPLGMGGSLSSSAKGKRSERDKEGNRSREALLRNEPPKIGRTTSGNIKGERKQKTKPKQKISQVFASSNGLVNKLPEQLKAEVSLHPGSGGQMKSRNEDEFLEEPIDLSHLQLPGMDLFGGPDDLDDQGQDIGSWLNMGDELPDPDGFDGLNGLEIPMDDLSDLNMKF